MPDSENTLLTIGIKYIRTPAIANATTAKVGSSGVWEKNNVSLFREENKTFGKTADDLRRTLEMPSGKGVHGINGFLPADAGPPHLYVNALASGPFQSATSS